jgi:NDP-sugar pyrophosphorylase family protein
METKAVILAGGMGKRFHPYSLVIPKPLIPIDEDPIILHLINQFKKSTITTFLLSVGYRAELIKAYLADGKSFGVDIRYFLESAPLGTAGPLSLMRDEFQPNEYFILINGDIYTEVNFEAMVAAAVRQNADILVGTVKKREKSSFGEIILNSSGTIDHIVEKPEREFVINAGIYVLNQRVLCRIPYNEFSTLPQLIELYLKEGRPVHVYDIAEYWMGIEDQDKIREVLEKNVKLQGKQEQ